MSGKFLGEAFDRFSNSLSVESGSLSSGRPVLNVDVYYLCDVTMKSVELKFDSRDEIVKIIAALQDGLSNFDSTEEES